MQNSEDNIRKMCILHNEANRRLSKPIFPPRNDSLTAEVKRTQQCDPAASGIVSTRIRTLFAHPQVL